MKALLKCRKLVSRTIQIDTRHKVAVIYALGGGGGWWMVQPANCSPVRSITQSNLDKLPVSKSVIYTQINISL